ncbi:Cilia- and flagella-associated protein 20 [Glycine soja]
MHVLKLAIVVLLVLVVQKIFKNTFQSGFLSILYSLGSKPLQIWDKEVVNAHVKRPQDEDIQSNVLEIIGSNIQSTYITCPADPAATLGIKLPFLVLIVKNLKKYFTFEIQVLDDKNVRRRFQASNFQVPTLHYATENDEGWNQIQFNLADFTKRAYGTNYVETLQVQVHANCRLRRIYLSDRLYSEEELPPEFKLYLPMQLLNTAVVAALSNIKRTQHLKTLQFSNMHWHLSHFSVNKFKTAQIAPPNGDNNSASRLASYRENTLNQYSKGLTNEDA